MKNRILLILKYINRFNFSNGLILYFQIYILNRSVIKLKNYPLINFRPKSCDIDIFNQVIINNEYNLFIKDENMLIVDGGANIGFTSLYFAKKYPNSIILSFEPDSDNFQLLKKNTESYKNIQSENKAIWSNDNGIVFYKSAQFDSHSCFSVSGTPSIVETISINEILRTSGFNRIRLLKLDIEGAEKELFNSSNIEWLNYVDFILIELHDRLVEGCSMSIFNALSSFSYNLSFQGELALIEIKSKFYNNIRI
jgi:FkbM family methyltransferase